MTERQLFLIIVSRLFAGYSYIDANGILQTVSYTADDQNGFRVRASNLPQPPKSNEMQLAQDAPEVVAAKRNHLDELQKSQVNWQDQNLLSYKVLPPYYSFAQIKRDEHSKTEQLNSNSQEKAEVNTQTYR